MRIGHLSIAATFLFAVGAIAFAANEPSTKPAAQSATQLPPGWTMEDMQAMIVAGTPGKMHERLASEVGAWKCKTTSWMGPESEPIMSEAVSKVTPLMAQPLPGIFYLSGAALIVSALLVGVQAFMLHAFCEYCLLSAALVLTIFLTTPHPGRRKLPESV